MPFFNITTRTIQDDNADMSNSVTGSESEKDVPNVTKPFFVPKRITRQTEIATLDGPRRNIPYVLTWWQRLFLTFDQPDTCVLGEAISIIMMTVIVLSCVVYVLSTDPGLAHRPSTCETPACKNDPEFCPDSEICEPVAPAVFEKIEAVCIGVFTVDYGIRVITVAALPARLAQILPDNWDNVQNPDGCLPDPEYPWYRKIYKYCTSTMNVIDLIAILPFYVGFATDSGSSVSIVRILRLARVLRVFKISGFSSGMGFISAAIKSATPAIGILLFFTVLGVILFGSVIYFLESGSFVVNRDFPDGAYVRWDVLHEQKERTPFSSILVSCYWAIVTSTTVGYGDLYPTTPLGRCVAIILMYVGILVLALPISVIGAAFTREYDKFHNRSSKAETGRTSTEGAPGNVSRPNSPLSLRPLSPTTGNEKAFVPISMGPSLGTGDPGETLRTLESFAVQLQTMTSAVNVLLARERERIIRQPDI